MLLCRGISPDSRGAAAKTAKVEVTCEAKKRSWFRAAVRWARVRECRPPRIEGSRPGSAGTFASAVGGPVWRDRPSRAGAERRRLRDRGRDARRLDDRHVVSADADTARARPEGRAERRARDPQSYLVTPDVRLARSATRKEARAYGHQETRGPTLPLSAGACTAAAPRGPRSCDAGLTVASNRKRRAAESYTALFGSRQQRPPSIDRAASFASTVRRVRREGRGLAVYDGARAGADGG